MLVVRHHGTFVPPAAAPAEILAVTAKKANTTDEMHSILQLVKRNKICLIEIRKGDESII